MNFNFPKFIQKFTSSFSSQETYFQLLLVVFSFLISYLLVIFCRKFFSRIIRKVIKSSLFLNRSKPSSKQKSSKESNQDKDRVFTPKQASLDFLEQRNRGILSWIVEYLSIHSLSLLVPLTTLLVLSFALIVYSLFFKNIIILVAAAKLVAMFFFLRLIRVSSQGSFTAKIVSIFLLPTLILHIFGVLDLAIQNLDNLDFKIGKARLSVYLIIKALIVFLMVFWLANLISRKSRFYIDSSRSIKSSTKGILNKISDILIYSIAVIFVLKTFGVDLTTFAVIGGAVGVGIGLGLQKIASNFISGVILLFEKSVEVGDIVEIDNGQIYGTVKQFSGRYTLVEASDGKEILIPNEEFITQKVTNWTYSNSRARIEVSVSVAYGSNLRQVKEIMMTCARSHRRCLINPEIECFVVSFDDFAIRFVLYFWVADIVDGRMGAKSDVMMAIYDEFARQGIEIPLPKREVKVSSSGLSKVESELTLFS